MQQNALLHVVAFSRVLISAVCILLHLAGCLENTRWGLGLTRICEKSIGGGDFALLLVLLSIMTTLGRIFP